MPSRGEDTPYCPITTYSVEQCDIICVHNYEDYVCVCGNTQRPLYIYINRGVVLLTCVLKFAIIIDIERRYFLVSFYFIGPYIYN